MFTLLHFLFTLLKIAIQASLYAAFLLILAKVLSRLSSANIVERVSINKWKFWVATASAISFSLFVFSFSYWGDHGLGDSSRIPVGFGQDIRNGDGEFTYFYTMDNKQRQIHNFQIHGNLLFAEQKNSEYLVFNFQNSELKEFSDRQVYEQFAKENGFPLATEFKDFGTHYRNYWNGWRFWLLA